jgi:Uma2 family endonuclease
MASSSSVRHTWSTVDFLGGRETLRRRELQYGVVREPPAPYYSHQLIVTNLTASLNPYVRAAGLGRLCVSPVDVVLDAAKALVVQPDVVFVSTPRLGIIRNQIWGAPDLVVEVLSPGTSRRDRTTKLRWYRAYGVRECWLVDPEDRSVEVIRFGVNTGGRDSRRCFRRRALVRSGVLPDQPVRAADVFD